MITLYSDIRKSLKTGDLVIWDTRKVGDIFDFILFLYQKIFKAKYTHMGVVVKIGDRYFIVEATPPKVRIWPLSKCRDFYLLKLDIPEKRTHLDSLLRRVGIKYSLLDMARSIFRLSNNPDADYCSDLANNFYNEIGFMDDEDAGRSPDSLVEALIKVSGNEPFYVKNDRGNLKDV